MEPGAVDLNLMSDEELAQLLEDARGVLASRQTSAAIARDVTAAVDPIIAANLTLLGEGWSHGRVSWDEDGLHVVPLPSYEDVPVPEDPGVSEPDPEPDPEVPDVRDWVAGIAVAPGDRVRFEGVVYRVVQAHTTAAHWRPDSLPALYEREG